MEYSFLQDMAREVLNEVAHSVRVTPFGENINLLKGIQTLTRMEWIGPEFRNVDLLEYKYAKWPRPTTRWPWPFRLFASRPIVVVRGADIYSMDGSLLFKIKLDSGSECLYPGDTLQFKSHSIKYTI